MGRTKPGVHRDGASQAPAWRWLLDFTLSHCVAVAPALGLLGWHYRAHPALLESLGFVLAVTLASGAALSQLARHLARFGGVVAFVVGLLVGALWGGVAYGFAFHVVDTGGESGLFLGPVLLPYFGFLGMLQSSSFTALYAARHRHKPLRLAWVLLLGLASALGAAVFAACAVWVESASPPESGSESTRLLNAGSRTPIRAS